VDATAKAALLVALEAEMDGESSRLNDAALQATVEFLARRPSEPLGCRTLEAVDPGDSVLGWDEANADIC
jgi:hypothetical protein